jgi:HEAT repeat protein
VKLARSISLFGYKAAFSGGMDSAGRALVDALDSDDETVRTLAGMFLVQSGKRAVPLLREALAARKQAPTVLTMLGDIADPATIPDLEAHVSDPDPEVARAAREALEILRRNELPLP